MVIALGLSVTWLAWQIAPAESSGMLVVVRFYAQERARTRVLDEGPTEQEIDEQLARIEAAMAQEGEVKEFKPSQPLPADTAIEMSSEL